MKKIQSFTREEQLPEWASLEQIAPIIGIKDRRTIDKLPIRKAKLGTRIVRYNTKDLIALIQKRTTGKAVVAA